MSRQHRDQNSVYSLERESRHTTNQVVTTVGKGSLQDYHMKSVYIKIQPLDRAILKPKVIPPMPGFCYKAEIVSTKREVNLAPTGCTDRVVLPGTEGEISLYLSFEACSR